MHCHTLSTLYYDSGLTDSFFLVQAELAAFEAQEDDEEGSDDDADGGRSHVTKSMASLDDLGSEDLDDAQSQVSFSSSRVGGAKSAVSFRLNPTYN